MESFKVGDKAVKPGHGVAEVIAIGDVEITQGIWACCYTFELLDIADSKKVRLFVPISNVRTVGLREIISEEQADEVFKILRKKEKVVESTTWNRRFREYVDKLKTGSVFEVAKVMRDLYLLKADKDLSFGERQMLDRARSLLIKELAISKNMTEDEVDNELRTIFKV